jgi:hypothetical protein
MSTINAAGLAMAAGTSPSHVQGVESDQLIFGTQLLQQNPFMLADYFRNYGNYYTTLTKMLPLIGKTPKRRVSYSPTTGHWEKPRVKMTFTVGSIEAGDEANQAVITLSADDMANDNGTISSLPRIKDTVEFQAGGHMYRIIAKDRTVNPNTITVEADEPDFDPMDEIIAGSIGNIFSNISGEGTGQNPGLRARQYYYENTFWIVKDTEGVTGSNLTTQVKFQPVPGSNLLWMEGLKDMELRHQYLKGSTWMFGKQPTGWTETSTFMEEEATVRGTQGLLDFIRQSGYEMEIDPNDFDINDLYALAAYYASINLPTSDIVLAQGYNINTVVERSLSDKLNYNWVIGVSDRYVAENFKRNWANTMGRDYDPAGAFINMGFKGFSLGQFTFLQTAAPEFNNGQGAGAIGYSNWTVALPLGDTSVTDNTGLEFQTSYVGYEVRGSNGYVREDELWMEAGAGNGSIINTRAQLNKTSPIDGVKFYIRTEMAPHFALGEQMALITPNGVSS